MKACTEASSRLTEARARGFKMKNFCSLFMALVVIFTLSGCEKPEEKKNEDEGRPELYKGFKPTDRSKSKGF